MKLAYLLAATLLIIPLASCDTKANATTHYDATANPFVALDLAKKEAHTGGKRILVIAGGDWCRWCVALESFISETPAVRMVLDRNFVIVEVYYGEKNQNPEFFSKLPRAAGYPHFWVLSSDGKVIHSVNTSSLEDGNGGYDKDRFLYFIQLTGPAGAH